jgi:hypothetical protein
MSVKELDPQFVDALLSQPHQLYVVDEIIKLSIGAFTSNISLSNTDPVGRHLPALTITASTKDMYRIAKEIIASIEANKTNIIEDIKQFTDNL